MVSDLFIMQDTTKIIRIQDTNGVWPQPQKQKYSQDYPMLSAMVPFFLSMQQHYVKIIRLDLDQDDNDGGEGADKVRSKKSPGATT